MEAHVNREMNEQQLRQILEQTLLGIVSSLDAESAELSVEQTVEQLAQCLWNSPAALREDAALSLCKTLLRRQHEGELGNPANEELPDLLLGLARQKIRKYYWSRRKEFPKQLDDFPDDQFDAQTEEEQRGQQEKKLALAQSTLIALRAAMKNDLHRRIWRHFKKWLETRDSQNDAARFTTIAQECNCSRRTVFGVWKTLEKLFDSAADAARKALAS